MTYASRKNGRLPLKDGEKDSNEEQETSPEDDPFWESEDSINKERFCLEYSPQNWRVTTKADEDGETAPNRVIWTYLPGRLNTVRIKATPTSDDRTSSSRYVVEKSNGSKTVTFYPPEPSFAATLELAQQIMRGCSGISFSKLKRRLNISAAAWRVHARLNDWSDLEKVAHNGRFDYIEGVDAKDNHRLWQAINGRSCEADCW